MKILITGCCGLIGSYLTEMCVNAGHEVVGIDNLSRGSLTNIKNILGSKNFEFQSIDIRKIEYLTIKKPKFSPDVVIHLAAVVPTKFFYEGEIETFLNNVWGTYCMLNWANYSSVKKFINGSSSEIYGHPIEIPTKEETVSVFDNPLETSRWSYAQGKLLTEHLGNRFSTFKKDFSVTHLRYANIYGPKDLEDNHVIPYIINRVLRNEKLVMSEYATQTRRTFIHARDCAEATLLSMNVNNETLNIGSQEEVTVSELVEMIFELVGKRVEIEYSLERKGDPERRYLDISKEKKLLNWEPKISLREGLKEMINEARKRI